MINKVIILVMLTFILSCEYSMKNIKWIKIGNYVCSDSYSKEKVLLLRTCFNQDTTILNGPKIFYNEKGRIIKWIWYSMPLVFRNKNNGKVPIFTAYYNEDGVFEEFIGNPFITFGSGSDGKTHIEMVAPPNTNKVVVIIDSFKQAIFNEYGMEPAETDSTCYVTLEDNPINTHKYLVKYQIEDSVKILSQYTLPIEFEETNTSH